MDVEERGAGAVPRAHRALNEISFRASCHQERQLNVTNSNGRRTYERSVCRWVRASLIDVPNFPERVLRRKRYPRQYIYSFFSERKASATFSLSFFSLRVSPRCTPGVTGVNSRGNCSWKISRSDPSIIDPDGNRVLGQNRSRDCSLQFVRVKNWSGLGAGGRVCWEIWKGSATESLTGRRF